MENSQLIKLNKTKPGAKDSQTPFAVLRKNIKITNDTLKALNEAQTVITRESNGKLLFAIYRGYFEESKLRRIRIFFAKILFILLYGLFGRAYEIKEIFENNTHPTGRAIDVVLYEKNKQGKWKKINLLMPLIRMFSPRWFTKKQVAKHYDKYILSIATMKDCGFTQIGNLIEDAQIHFYLSLS
jgi:hypothetical protein